MLLEEEKRACSEELPLKYEKNKQRELKTSFASTAEPCKCENELHYLL